MKKLMIAMGAAAIFTLGAQGEVIPTVLQGGMDFEGYDVGAVISASTDPGDQTGGRVFWGSDGESSVVVVAEDNKYLSLDTTQPLLRKTSEESAESVKPVAIPANGGEIIISSKVQFTAAATAPEYVENVDKLLVWAKEPEEGAEDQSIKLWVTSMQDNGKIEPAETACVIDLAKWYDLEIKAVKDENPSALSPIKFTVSIKAEDAEVATEVGTYVSMVSSGKGGASTIEAVGFKGTGAVDDIAFKSVTGEVAAPVRVEVDFPADVEVFVGEEEQASYEAPLTDLVVGETVVLLVSVEGEGATVSAKVGDTSLTPEYDADLEMWKIQYELKAADAEAGVTITITVESPDPGPDPDPTEDPEIVTEDGQTVKDVIDAATSESGIPLKNCKAGDVTVDNDAHTVKVGSSDAVSIPEYYTAAVAKDFSKIELVLNEKALEEETDVSVSDAELGLTITESNEKLYYGLSSSETVNGTYAAPDALVLGKGKGQALTLKAEKKGNACFYRLYVTDIAPATK